MMMPPQALLLDLDDTIVSFSASADPCWRRVCARFDDRLTGVTASELFAAIARCRSAYWGDPLQSAIGRRDLWSARRDIVAGAFEQLGVGDTDLAHALADAYSREREDDSAVWLLPGAIPALRYFREQHLLTALITNGSAQDQRRKIERFALAPYFDCIVIEGELGAGKPDPGVYEHALTQLAVGAEDTWMVGDNLEWDVIGAQRVGILGVWIDASGQGLPNGSDARPDLVVASLAELAARLGAD